MTLAKATVTGTVYRAPEKRYTQNDIAVYGFTLNIDEKEETLVRVVSKRRVLSDLLDGVKKGDKLLVDGRLQVATSKAPDGSDRKYFEIDANDIELLSGAAVSSVTSGDMNNDINTSEKQDEIVAFAETDFSEESLIDEDEIPF